MSGTATLSGLLSMARNIVRVIFITWLGNFAVQDSMYCPAGKLSRHYGASGSPTCKNLVALFPPFAVRSESRQGGTAKVLNIAKPPVVLTQLAIQRSAMHGIRLEAPTRFRTRRACPWDSGQVLFEFVQRHSDRFWYHRIRFRPSLWFAHLDQRLPFAFSVLRLC